MPDHLDAFDNLATLGVEMNLGEAKWVPADRVVPNPEQPRQTFSEKALQELADNLKAHGMLQPILVRAQGDRYEIVAGERRFRAAQRAGLTRLPVIIKRLSDQEALEIGLAENLLREDLHPLEEAATLKRLVEQFSYSYEELGSKLGKGKNYVWHRTNLLKLPEDVQLALRQEPVQDLSFTPGHAEAVAQIKDPVRRTELIKEIFEQGLSVMEVRRRLRLLTDLEERFVDKRSQDRLAEAVIQKGISQGEFDRRSGRMKDRMLEDETFTPRRQRLFPFHELGLWQIFKEAELRGDHAIDAFVLLRVLQGDLKKIRAVLFG